jgi:hypothetical protein
MTTPDLAQLVLNMLSEQQKYFRMRRQNLPEAQKQLDISKSHEAHVKKICNDIIENENKKQAPELFG